MKKTIIYIDGQNIHHGLADALGLDSRYLNFRKFCEEKIACAEHGKQIVAIKYYSAKYPQERDPVKHSRDADFFKVLEEAQNIRVVEGKFRIPQDKTLPPVEKGVDVRLATDLIFDAFLSEYEVAYVLSADTDLVPAIRQIKGNAKFKNLVINNFSFNKLNDFIHACDYVGLIYPNVIKKYHDPKNFGATPAGLAHLANKFNSKK